MLNLSPAWVGFLRGIGTVVLFAVLSFLANSANLTPVLGTSLAGIVSGLILAIENSLGVKSGTSLFGATRR